MARRMSLGPRLGAKPVAAACQVADVSRSSASLPSMNQCLPEACPRSNPSLSSRPRHVSRCVLDISPNSGAGPQWTPQLTPPWTLTPTRARTTAGKGEAHPASSHQPDPGAVRPRGPSLGSSF